MMHKAWSSIEEVPYCFSMSSVKFQGHTAKKNVDFVSNWAFPDCNSSLNSPIAIKCCTKLETAKERCPIVFQVHPSYFKIARDKTSPILTQIGFVWTIGRSQLSNPSDLPCSENNFFRHVRYISAPVKTLLASSTHWGRMMYICVIQIKICAEYQDMLPRPRLVCQEPGLRPIGLSPGVPDKSSRGLGSMSRYSAQI